MGPLYARSEYSLLESVLTVDRYVKQCQNYGYRYATLSDHNVLFGAKKFQQLCARANIKPLYALEFDCMDNDQTILFEAIAKDEQGYIELLQLSTLVTSAPVTIDYLSHLNHCVLIIFNEQGLLEQATTTSSQQLFNEQIAKVRGFHPQDNYVGLTYQQSRYWANANQNALHYANALQLPCCCINRCYYLNKEDSFTHKVVNAIRLDKKISDVTLIEVNDHHLLAPDEWNTLYPVSLLENNERIAEQCNVNLDNIKTSLPTYPLDNPDISSGAYLQQLAYVGLKKRLNCDKLPANYLSRLKYELGIIDQMGFNDYFLIVFDYIRYAKKKGILVGPGRGSAAGSLVSYSVGITEIDPIEYDLLFERFLNPSRHGMPDIDTDFPDIDRDDVIRYVYEKYGQQHVAHILTFGTLAAKQVVRDVGKVFELSQFELDKLSKSIPNAPKITLQQAMDQSASLRQQVHDNPKIAQVIQIARQLEGLPRHCSTHAGGIVFSKKPFDQCCPMIQLSEDMLTTQYTMEYLEDMGLIKMDFLGLRNLTVLDTIVKMVQPSHPNFKLSAIPLDDSKVYRMIAKGETTGIFQLESEGMRSLLKRMQPTCFNDIVAANALFRPGPMENIPLYLENKKHQDRIVYENEAVRKILQPTYGVMVYQEQIMQLSQVLAGFSLAKADILRKAMSKKKAGEFEKLRNDFIEGCIKNGYSRKSATDWADKIVKFAGYGFNKSHSVAYGLVAYQLAYLKIHASLPFYCAYLNSIIGATAKMNQVLSEIKNYGIKIAIPSINHSQLSFTIYNNALQFPFLCIKSIGSVAAMSIVEDRNKNGNFTSYFNCIARLVNLKLSTSNIECLIDAGCLDEFSSNRLSMKQTLPQAIRYGELIRVNHPDGSYHLQPDLLSEPYMITVKENTYDKAINEANVLGLFLSINPFEQIKQKYNIQADSLYSCMQRSGTFVSFGQITRVKQHRTKKGDLMAFVTLMDETGSFDFSMMPFLYNQVMDKMESGMYAKVSIKVGNAKGAIIDKIWLYS